MKKSKGLYSENNADVCMHSIKTFLIVNLCNIYTHSDLWSLVQKLLQAWPSWINLFVFFGNVQDHYCWDSKSACAFMYVVYVFCPKELYHWFWKHICSQICSLVFELHCIHASCITTMDTCALEACNYGWSQAWKYTNACLTVINVLPWICINLVTSEDCLDDC